LLNGGLKMCIDKGELLELLENKYGDLDNECGCSVFVNGEYEWLSIKNIVDIIESCATYDE
jgi:hypothetical protein